MNQFSNIDLSILKRYDKPGPRYTSYPTAPLFRKDFGGAEYEAEILRTNQPHNNTPLSLYFHIPFCDTLCYFCGCNMLVTLDRAKISEYLGFLKKEIDLVSARVNPARKVTQIHWGGGTPTFISHAQMSELMQHTRDAFSLRNDDRGEYSIELDPREADASTIEPMSRLIAQRVQALLKGE